MPFNKIRTFRRLFTCVAVLMTIAAAWLAFVAYRYVAALPEADRLVFEARALAARVQARQADITRHVLDACEGELDAAAAYENDRRELMIALGDGARLTRQGVPAWGFFDMQASLWRFLEVHQQVLAECRENGGATKRLTGGQADAVVSPSREALQDFMNAASLRRDARAHALFYVALLLAVLLFGWVLWIFGTLALRRTERAHRELIAQRAVLAQSEQRFRLLFEHAPSGIVRVTADGNILAANPAVLRILGYQSEEELLGVNISTLYDEKGVAERLSRMAGEGDRIGAGLLRWKHRDGRSIEVRLQRTVVRDGAGVATEFEDVVEEVTDALKVEEQFRQAQKMEAIGRLAGGVAHDFNNLLTVILGNVELLREALPAEHDAAVWAGQIEQAASSAGALTRQLLTFSRKRSINREPVDLNKTVVRVCALLQRVLGEDVQLVSDLAPDAGIIVADAVHFEQAIMNLAVNARDAMPAGGRLTLRTRVMPGARRVQLDVTDTGCGMDAETQRHVFEPFFTTKSAGKGTGLGLAMVFGVVKQMEGAIEVQSELGRGTTFTLTMERLEAVVPAPPFHEPADACVAAKERILVVEDEPAVSAVVEIILSRQGYAVTTVGSAEDALDVLARRQDVDLVLSDIVMRGKSGLELAGIIRSDYPELSVVLMSGYSAQHAMPPATGFVEKPIRPITLLSAVRDALDANRSRAMPGSAFQTA